MLWGLLRGKVRSRPFHADAGSLCKQLQAYLQLRSCLPSGRPRRDGGWEAGETTWEFGRAREAIWTYSCRLPGMRPGVGEEDEELQGKARLGFSGMS